MNAITPRTGSDATRRARIGYGMPIYNQVMDFLIDEARLLDHRRLAEWGELLAPDLVYRAPVRTTRRVAGFDHEFGATGHFDEDHASLTARIDRLVNTSSAWSEDPASRTRRYVTNVVVHETGRGDEFAVSSYLFLTRNRADAKDSKQLCAERNDLLRRVDDRFLLARREILIDQVVLGMPNLAIFL